MACNVLGMPASARSVKCHAYWLSGVKIFFQNCYKSLHGRAEKLGKIIPSFSAIIIHEDAKIAKKPALLGAGLAYIKYLYVALGSILYSPVSVPHYIIH